MSNTTAAPIVLTPAALALVKDASANGRKDGRIADAYVVEMGVTVETVAEHVAIFRDHFRDSFPKTAPANPADVKAYATLWRNRLNRVVGKGAATAGATDYLAAVIKAADAARDNNIDAAAVREAIESWALANLA